VEIRLVEIIPRCSGEFVMGNEPNIPADQPPKTLDQLLAEAQRENERLRRQLSDVYRERDEFKKLFLEELAQNTPEPTEDELKNSIPARPLIEQLITRLENP
jgi:hypothetical protein